MSDRDSIKDTSGAELITIAGVVAVKISECMDDPKDLAVVAEFLGLLRHNIDIIRHRGRARIKHEPRVAHDEV